MRRTQIYLDEDQDRRLEARARGLGATKSALIRQAVDVWLRHQPDDDELLRAFRTAVQAAAGIEPDLPDGATYIDELRAADRAREAGLDASRRP